MRSSILYIFHLQFLAGGAKQGVPDFVAFDQTGLRIFDIFGAVKLVGNNHGGKTPVKPDIADFDRMLFADKFNSQIDQIGNLRLDNDVVGVKQNRFCRFLNGFNRLFNLFAVVILLLVDASNTA